jgi:hypothetical protein
MQMKLKVLLFDSIIMWVIISHTVSLDVTTTHIIFFFFLLLLFPPPSVRPAATAAALQILRAAVLYTSHPTNHPTSARLILYRCACYTTWPTIEIFVYLYILDSGNKPTILYIIIYNIIIHTHTKKIYFCITNISIFITHNNNNF